MRQLVILVACGILGGMAQLFMGESLRWAPASVTASFEYTSLLFAITIGFLVFEEVPGRNTLFGGAMVICAGLFIIWRERRRGVEKTRAERDLPPH